MSVKDKEDQGSRVKLTWQNIFTWMLIANGIYILLFFLIMKIFN